MPVKKAWSTCTTSRWTAPRGKKSSARISPPDTTTPSRTCRSSYLGMRRCLRPTAARNAWRCSRASRATAPGCVRRCIIAGGTRTTPMRHSSMMSGRDSTRRYFANTGKQRRPTNVGVRRLAGSDSGANEYSVPGFSLHDELAELVGAGLTPMQVLQSATLNAARYLGITDAFGTVELGKTADLVLLEGNPLEDIRNTR